MARTLEAAGFSTILVTMMPYWAQKIGTPRTLAVEHPFGHTLGRPGDREGQLKTIREALRALQSIQKPGTILHSDSQWPIPIEAAIKAWQPSEPSPIIRELRPKFRQMLREHRKK
ncbi:MAG: hypothetical protein PVI81_06475 [Anaerolineales bacterium]|jgi:hypothetical protein